MERIIKKIEQSENLKFSNYDFLKINFGGEIEDINDKTVIKLFGELDAEKKSGIVVFDDGIGNPRGNEFFATENHNLISNWSEIIHNWKNFLSVIKGAFDIFKLKEIFLFKNFEEKKIYETIFKNSFVKFLAMMGELVYLYEEKLKKLDYFSELKEIEEGKEFIKLELEEEKFIIIKELYEEGIKIAEKINLSDLSNNEELEKFIEKSIEKLKKIE
ncbi:MAG: hypothetical protein V1910_02615 [bacterium]